jgi:predicted GNAT family acetyltransferase
MRIVRESDPKSFLDKVGAHLQQLPAENSLLLGLLSELAREGGIPGREHDRGNAASVLLWAEGERGEVAAVALQTPPRSLIVTRASNEAIDAVLELAFSANLALPGVVAPSHVAERLASEWGKRTQRAAVLRMNERLYALERVQFPAPCAGELREAKGDDESILAAWLKAFVAETDIDAIPDFIAFARGKMAAHQLFVWDAGGPVSMAAWMGRTEQGVRIGYVYTPPAERKKGYASAIVAALSQRLLDEGCPRCFLFTNAANPTSNKIYSAIGYEHVCDFRMYGFPER